MNSIVRIIEHSVLFELFISPGRACFQLDNFQLRREGRWTSSYPMGQLGTLSESNSNRLHSNIEFLTCETATDCQLTSHQIARIKLPLTFKDFPESLNILQTASPFTANCRTCHPNDNFKQLHPNSALAPNRFKPLNAHSKFCGTTANWKPVALPTTSKQL